MSQMHRAPWLMWGAWIATAIVVALTSADVGTSWHAKPIGALEQALPWLLLASALALIATGSAAAAVAALVVSISAVAASLSVSVLATDVERGIATYLAVLLAPAVAAVVLALACDRQWERRDLVLGAGLVVVALLGVLHTAFHDPFLDVSCRRFCATNVVMVNDQPGLANVLLKARLIAAVAVSIVISARVIKSGRHPWLVAPGVAALIAIAAAPLLDANHPDLADGIAAAEVVLTALVGLLAIAVAWKHLAVRLRVRAFAASFAAAEAGPLESGLAAAVGDPSLRLGYPATDGSDLVCPDGTPFVCSVGRGRTELAVRSAVVVVVDHDPSVSTIELQRQFGEAARMAAWNEGLRADLLLHLDVVRASRRRIVVEADRERRRIERDLHDGAQQHLLAITYDLRGLRRTCGPALVTDIDAAIAELASAHQELREVATEIFPVVVAEAGLEAALLHLAERASRPVEVDAGAVDVRQVDVAHAVYRFVERALDSEDDRLARVSVRSDGQTATIRIDGTSVPIPAELQDRVSAVGGCCGVLDDRWEVLVPCGS